MKTTFIAAGDSFITRRIPEAGYPGFNELKALVESHDVRFVNLESTFHDQEGYPAATSGGTWAMSDPRTLDDICRMGFNFFLNQQANTSCSTPAKKAASFEVAYFLM